MKNAILHHINTIADRYSNAIPVFGYAYHMDTIDMDSVIKKLPEVICAARFFKWHAGEAEACRTFCNICFIDPMLIEAYIGMRFEELVQKIG
jgi:hypothetical protein